ncbi:hypothetical protein [Gemmobacter sp.]|uniref:hypothetical protein n=1 Tax=Gemmobacter sp. TaxID=1898957 RepID=UPI002AFFC698|nr:hypothetical protein [Gemmobacter sp.]
MSQHNAVQPPGQPEWMQGFVPQKGKVENDQPPRPRGNPAWVKGGPSPNPHGRIVNLGGPRIATAKLLQENVQGILEKQIAKALEGDTSAAQLVLSRVLAPLRVTGERVQFPFDPEASIPKQIEQVLAAVAAGEVPPDVGQQIIAAIGTLSQARVVEDLADKVAALTAKDITP